MILPISVPVTAPNTLAIIFIVPSTLSGGTWKSLAVPDNPFNAFNDANATSVKPAVIAAPVTCPPVIADILAAIFSAISSHEFFRAFIILDGPYLNTLSVTSSPVFLANLSVIILKKLSIYPQIFDNKPSPAAAF